jgi:hypothetical protein
MKQNLCSTLAVIHIKTSNEPFITTNNGILVSSSIVRIYFL